MYLAAVADLRSSLGFDDMTDINDAIGAALDAAETQLASVLRTEFGQVNVVDTFFIEETMRMGRAVKTELLLSRGFVSSQPISLIVNQISPIWLSAFDIVQANYNASGGGQIIGGLPGPTPNFVFSLEKGHGVDATNFYEATYISVAYVAGFATDPDTADSYLISSVPQWLQNAAKLMALILLADAAVITESGIVIDKKMNEQQLRLLTQPKVRYKPLALDPFIDPVYS
jgi:hypothetical protein